MEEEQKGAYPEEIKKSEALAGNGNEGQKENQEDMGIPGKEREQEDENLEAGQESLPSDGPVSQSEGTEAPDLDTNPGRDD